MMYMTRSWRVWSRVWYCKQDADSLWMEPSAYWVSTHWQSTSRRLEVPAQWNNTSTPSRLQLLCAYQ